MIYTLHDLRGVENNAAQWKFIVNKIKCLPDCISRYISDLHLTRSVHTWNGVKERPLTYLLKYKQLTLYYEQNMTRFYLRGVENNAAQWKFDNPTGNIFSNPSCGPMRIEVSTIKFLIGPNSPITPHQSRWSLIVSFKLNDNGDRRVSRLSLFHFLFLTSSSSTLPNCHALCSFFTSSTSCTTLPLHNYSDFPSQLVLSLQTLHIHLVKLFEANLDVGYFVTHTLNYIYCFY